VALEQAARDFGVPAQQIVRDLKVLWYCGLPGLGPGDLIDIDMEALESEEGDGMIRLANAEYLSRPLRLGSSEAAALVVALRAMREGSPDTSRAAIDRVLAKLERATADGSAADVVEVPSHAADTAKVRTAVGEAIDGGRQLRLEYYVPTRDETTERVVDPLALLEAEGTPISTRGATSRRPAGCSGWTGSPGWRSSTRPRWSTTCPRVTCPRASSSRDRTTCRRPSGCTASRAGWRSTTRSSRRPSSRTAGSRWCSAWATRSGWCD
jgi:hypothetical protein